MRFAYSLGANVVLNAVGRVPEETDHPAYVQLQASLSDLDRHGQHVGARLACETGSEPVSQLARLLASLPEEGIGLAYNPGNLIVNDFYDRECTRLAAKRTLALIASDGVRDLARGRGMDVALGQGSAEFPEVLGALEEQHFAGWMHVAARDPRNPVDEISNAVSYLNTLLLG